MSDWIKRHRWDGIVTPEQIVFALTFWAVCVGAGVVAALWVAVSQL